MTVEYFAVMSVRFLKDGTLHNKSFQDTVLVQPGDTEESVFWWVFGELKREHGFETCTVGSWSLMPNELSMKPPECEFLTCTNSKVPGLRWCKPHADLYCF